MCILCPAMQHRATFTADNDVDTLRSPPPLTSYSSTQDKEQQTTMEQSSLMMRLMHQLAIFVFVFCVVTHASRAATMTIRSRYDS